MMVDDKREINSPIKKSPDLYTKNDKTILINKRIKINATKRIKSKTKNLIIIVIALNKPPKKLYSLCLGSRIIIFSSF